MEKKFEELQTAKANVRYLLENEASLVDMHGLEYWTSVVVRLRKEIKDSL